LLSAPWTEESEEHRKRRAGSGSCQFQVFDDEVLNSRVIIQVQPRQLGLDALVARDGDDMRIVRMQQRLAGRGAPDFELGDGGELEALHQQQVAGRKALELLLERRLVRAAQL